MCNVYRAVHDSALMQLFNVTGLSPDVAEAAGASVYPKGRAIVLLNEGRQLTTAHWGLLAGWSEPKPSKTRPGKLDAGLMPNNARDDKLERTGIWRAAVEHRRCLVPAEYFVEWTKSAPMPKPKWKIGLKSGEPLAFAGLWSRYTWQGTPDVLSCTVITTAANELIAPIHDRMPVILPRSAWDEWLRPDKVSLGDVGHLLRPYDPAEMTAERV